VAGRTGASFQSSDIDRDLGGVRVLEVGTFIDAAFAGKLLADLGAEVVKVEDPERPDLCREFGPFPGDVPDDEASGLFLFLNCNKQGVTLNLATATGRELFGKLVARSDVLIEGLGKRTAQSLGLDYDSLRSVNPNIVMLSMPGAGSSGPLRDLVLYGPSLSSLAGLDALAGYRNEEPLGTHVLFYDCNSASHAAYAVVAALWHRTRTGQGQRVEEAQWEAAVAVLGEAILQYEMTGVSPEPQGNFHPMMAPHNLYRCQGDPSISAGEVDQWVAIAVATDEEWRALCGALGHAEWAADPAFMDLASRQQNVDRLDALITQWTCQRTADEATKLLQAAGVAASPYFETGERFLDPHFQERGIYVDVDHPVTGRYILSPIPPKMSDTPPAIQRPAPMLGEHNAYVFEDLLGMTASERQRLEEEQALY